MIKNTHILYNLIWNLSRDHKHRWFCKIFWNSKLLVFDDNTYLTTEQLWSRRTIIRLDVVDYGVLEGLFITSPDYPNIFMTCDQKEDYEYIFKQLVIQHENHMLKKKLSSVRFIKI